MQPAEMLARIHAGAYEYVEHDRARSRIARVLPDGPRLIVTYTPFGGPPAPHGVLDLIKLAGPHVTPLVGVYDDHGAHVAEVEPPGAPIERALADGPLPLADAVAIAAALADTLVDCHARGQTLWGAFLDPELLYVARGRDGWRLSGVAPRGPVARARAAALERGMYNPPPPPPVHVIALLSPESAEGRAAGPPADVFSLCACLHWWATGATLYARDHAHPLAVLQDVIAGARAPSFALPPALAAIVTAGTTRDPAARPSAAQVRAALG